MTSPTSLTRIALGRTVLLAVAVLSVGSLATGCAPTTPAASTGADASNVGSDASSTADSTDGTDAAAPAADTPLAGGDPCDMLPVWQANAVTAPASAYATTTASDRSCTVSSQDGVSAVVVSIVDTGYDALVAQQPHPFPLDGQMRQSYDAAAGEIVTEIDGSTSLSIQSSGSTASSLPELSALAYAQWQNAQYGAPAQP